MLMWRADVAGEDVEHLDVALSRKKRKKLRIKAAGGASGARVVFDEDGNALDPLQQLAQAGFDE